MKPLKVYFGFFLLVFLSACGGVERETITTDETPPNLILILTDDQRADTMPYLPSLSGYEGMNFTNAYVSTPLCCPSRTSILTGQYAHNHGVKDNKAPNGGFTAFQGSKDDETLATSLQATGYTTALVGKYLNGYGEEVDSYIPEGWDSFFAFGGRPNFYDYDLLDYKNGENKGFVHYGSESEDYSTTVLADLGVDFIKNAEQPFFLYFAPFAPHSPSTPQDQYKGTFVGTEGEIFGEMVESLYSVDEAFDSFIEILEETGELDNTYVVFMSDNGYHLGENGIEEGKNTPYEVAVKVPLKIFGPGLGASEREELVLNIDLAPTLLELAGAEPLSEADGRSYAAMLSGEPIIEWRDDFLLEVWGKYEFSAVHEKDWVYIQFKRGEAALYDLLNDPLEEKNLINEFEQSERLEIMKTRLEELKVCSGEVCF